MSRARDAAEQAMRLDPSETEVQAAVGFVRFRIDWNWEAAEQAFRHACELSPDHALPHHRLALLLSALGRHDEARLEIQRAHELDPLSLIIGTAVGRVLHFQRHYDEAIDQIRRTLDLDPRFVQARLDLGMSYAQAGQVRRSGRGIRSRSGAGRSAQADAVGLGPHLRECGTPRRRGERAARSRTPVSSGRSRIVRFVAPLVALGRVSEGLEWLERACDAHSGLLAYLRVEPMFDAVRHDSRFQGLMRRLAFPDQ